MTATRSGTIAAASRTSTGSSPTTAPTRSAPGTASPTGLPARRSARLRSSPHGGPQRTADARAAACADPSRMYTLHEFFDDHFGVGDTRLMYGITVPLLLGVVSISLLI